MWLSGSQLGMISALLSFSTPRPRHIGGISGNGFGCPCPYHAVTQDEEFPKQPDNGPGALTTVLVALRLSTGGLGDRKMRERNSFS